MTFRIQVYLFFFIGFWVISSSCNLPQYLADGEVLLYQNKVAFTSDENLEQMLEHFDDKYTLSQELLTLTQQKPNRKIMGLFMFNLWVYYKANEGLENGFKWWLKNKVGEPPVIYKDEETQKTIKRMKDYMYNKGYFYADIDYSLNEPLETKILAQYVDTNGVIEFFLEQSYKVMRWTLSRLSDVPFHNEITLFKELVNSGQKKVVVTYEVTSNDLYVINDVHFPEGKDRVSRIIRYHVHDSHLQYGNPFDVDKLQEERERINLELKNEGYFSFNQEYISFEVDSLNKQKKLDIHVKVSIPAGQDKHEVYKYGDIYLYPDYSVDNFTSPDTSQINGFFFIGDKIPYNPEVLLDDIFIEPGRNFAQRDYDLTINRLSDLDMFQYVNIRFKPWQTDSTRLDCHIYMMTSKKQEMTVETEANTNTDYFLGTALKYTYKSKNLFKNADLLILNLKGGVEFQDSSTIFNTVDISSSMDFYLPKFLVPWKMKKVARINNPRSVFSLSYNYLQRINLYAINSTSLNFGYDWKETALKRHLFHPMAISLISLNKNRTSDSFFADLDRNPLLRKSFEPQLILGQTYAFLYSNQPLKQKNVLFFRGDIDLSGNMATLTNLIFNNRFVPGESTKLLGVFYSQYAKMDADVRYYYLMNRRSTLVNRVFLGVGVPYGNSEVLPYVKQYFAGGSNGIRAWTVRTLGPGSYNATADTSLTADGIASLLDQTGDIKLETNMEFRFNMIGLLKGAFFVDAGNIWNIHRNSLIPEGNFDLKHFPAEVAIGTGLGARLDFTFFVLRIDVGFKLRDPSLYERNPDPDARRVSPWVVSDVRFLNKGWRQDNLVYNIALGYPF